MAGMPKYTKEMLEPIVVRSTTWAEVCREVGVKPFTGSQTHLTNRAKEFGINYDHFVGQGHNKGKTFKKKDIESYLVENSKISSGKLRVRLISEGYKEARCEICRQAEWQGLEIPLELDHKNSDHWDNRLDNLQIICPNCHAIETLKRKK